MPQHKTQFINLSEAEKNELILRTSAQLKISPILIEKDFWVSWLLNKIFSLGLSKDITFKGGTSLSKCYGLISRFSEDIDLTIDRHVFTSGIEEDGLSNKELKRLVEGADKEGSTFIKNHFKPALEKEISTCIAKGQWEILTDETEIKNLRFYYPATQRIIDNNYVKQSVLMEFGVRGEITPSENQFVVSYIENEHPEFLEFSKNSIRTLSPIRTFWEKITLLHAENNRPKEKAIGDRLSRHYYDIYQLIIKGVADSAVNDLSLLLEVIEHKRRYFRSSWAAYESAFPPTLKIVPHDTLMGLLKADYKQMQGMLFNNPPSFEMIMEQIKEFELRMNQLEPNISELKGASMGSSA